MSNVIRITALAALLLTPAAARAQDTLDGWRGLNVSSLDTVFVTEDGGRRTEGKLLSLDTKSLVLLVDGAEQRFEAARVQRIDKRGDSVRNGALIGLGLGVLFGSIGAGITDCPGDPGGSCAGFRAATFGVAIASYTALGTAVDALIVRRTRVFDAGERNGAGILGGGPQLAFRVRW